MKTSKMIEGINIEQRAWSANLGCIVRYDELQGLIIENSDKSDLVGKNLGMSHFVITTDDWILSPDTLKDFNEIFSNMNTEDGVTLVTSTGMAYSFNRGNMHTILDFMSMETIIEGKWFNGFVTPLLRKFGYIK